MVTQAVRPQRALGCPFRGQRSPVVASAAPRPPSATPRASLDAVKARLDALAPKLCALGAAALVTLAPALDAAANEKIGEFATSGLLPVPGVFRDTVQVMSLKDPGVEGVTL